MLRERAVARTGQRAGGVGNTNRSGAAYVRWVQRSLNRALGLRLAEDGVAGAQTRSAIRAFQARSGLAPDGVVGPRTEAALIASGAPTPDRPAATAPAGAGARTCPSPARMARDRCRNPGTQRCPAIPDLLCLTRVGDAPFEYPLAVGLDRATGLRVVTRRQPERVQRFVPAVRAALERFIGDMRRFAMPIEAILTQGSLYCRCVSNSDSLSNHSFGDAIDVAGVRWPPFGGPASRLRETIVHNFADAGERALLRRINACLRLSFATVIDYNYNAQHRDHFHCDMNRGRGRQPRGRTATYFTQEALGVVLGRRIPMTGAFDAATVQALREFSGLREDVLRGGDNRELNRVLDALYTRVAAGR